jgi:hypothetical protein
MGLLVGWAGRRGAPRAAAVRAACDVRMVYIMFVFDLFSLVVDQL